MNNTSLQKSQVFDPRWVKGQEAPILCQVARESGGGTRMPTLGEVLGKIVYDPTWAPEDPPTG